MKVSPAYIEYLNDPRQPADSFRMTISEYTGNVTLTPVFVEKATQKISACPTAFFSEMTVSVNKAITIPLTFSQLSKSLQQCAKSNIIPAILISEVAGGQNSVGAKSQVVIPLFVSEKTSLQTLDMAKALELTQFFCSSRYTHTPVVMHCEAVVANISSVPIHIDGVLSASSLWQSNNIVSRPITGVLLQPREKTTVRFSYAVENKDIGITKLTLTVGYHNTFLEAPAVGTIFTQLVYIPVVQSFIVLYVVAFMVRFVVQYLKSPKKRL